MNHQDWKPVIIKKSYNKLKKEGKIKPKKVVKKNINSNSNLKINAKKIENSESLKHDKVSKIDIKKIQRARLDAKMTQQDLARKLNVKKSLINDLESGKLIKNNQFISKVKRALKIK